MITEGRHRERLLTDVNSESMQCGSWLKGPEWTKCTRKHVSIALRFPFLANRITVRYTIVQKERRRQIVEAYLLKPAHPYHAAKLFFSNASNASATR